MSSCIDERIGLIVAFKADWYDERDWKKKNLWITKLKIIIGTAGF